MGGPFCIIGRTDRLYLQLALSLSILFRILTGEYQPILPKRQNCPMLLLEKARKMVAPYYQDKDIMHDFSHIERILNLAVDIGQAYQYDEELLHLGAYFHGMIYVAEAEVVAFLTAEGMTADRIKQVVQIAWGSQKEETAGSIEGKILHDAHLLEGGKTFFIVKSLVTGTARGQTLEQTLAYIEAHVIGQFQCLLPTSQAIYQEKETFTKAFLSDLRQHL